MGAQPSGGVAVAPRAEVSLARALTASTYRKLYRGLFGLFVVAPGQVQPQGGVQCARPGSSCPWPGWSL